MSKINACELAIKEYVPFFCSINVSLSTKDVFCGSEPKVHINIPILDPGLALVLSVAVGDRSWGSGSTLKHGDRSGEDRS